MINAFPLLASMALLSSSNILSRSNSWHLQNIDEKNHDEQVISQSFNQHRFPFSEVKFNTIKVTQDDIDMAITKCIEMDKNFSHENSATAGIELTPAAQHVFQVICDNIP